jgi:hypothetical protein
VALYVDGLVLHPPSPVMRRLGRAPRETCHLASDVGVLELHEFAKRVLPAGHFVFHAHDDHPHYDLDAVARDAAIAAGATAVGSRELVRRCFPRR